MNQEMTPLTSHLAQAFYNWITENKLTPHIVALATLPGVEVPDFAVNDGQVTLNLAERACTNLVIDSESIRCTGYFNKIGHEIIIPLYSLVAIYARENGSGTQFTPATLEEVRNMGIECPEDASSDQLEMSVVKGEADQNNEAIEELTEKPEDKPGGIMRLL